MIARNLDQLRSPHRIDSLVSREATFLFNNLLFVALAFAILWGVLFPSISEALAGHRVATQSPYYDFFAVVLGLPLLLLAGIGPGGGVAPRLAARRRAGLPLAVRLGARGRARCSCCSATPRASPASSRSASASSSTVTICLELARGTAARRALTPGTSWPAALAQLVGRNRRRYGGYVVHLAVMIGVVAIVGTSAYATSRTLVLAPGQTVQFHGYGLKLRGIESPITRSYISTEAVVDVYQGGKRVDTLRPVGAHLPRLGRADQADRDPPAAAHRRGSLPRLRRLAAARRGHDQGVRESARQPALALRHRPRARLRHRHLARSAPRGPAGAAHERGVRARSLMADRRDRPARARRGRGRARGLAARARAQRSR